MKKPSPEGSWWTHIVAEPATTVPSYLDALFAKGQVNLALEQLEAMSDTDRARFDGIMKCMLKTPTLYAPSARRRIAALARRKGISPEQSHDRSERASD